MERPTQQAAAAAERLAAGVRHQLQQPAASVPVAAGATGATAGGPFDGWLMGGVELPQDHTQRGGEPL